MQKYQKVYYDYFGLTIADFIECEICNKQAVDIHHILFKSRGGKDEIENLAALCRDCHLTAHSNAEFNVKVKQTHLELYENNSI